MPAYEGSKKLPLRIILEFQVEYQINPSTFCKQSNHYLLSFLS